MRNKNFATARPLLVRGIKNYSGSAFSMVGSRSFRRLEAKRLRKEALLKKKRGL
jgi:hypothetical protein